MKSAFIKLTLLIVALTVGVIAQKPNKSPTQKPTKNIFHNLDDKAVPIFAFTYFDPWRKIYGSDMPEFVLYQDGTVVFERCREKDNPYSCYYVTAKLPSDEIAQLMIRLLPQKFYAMNDEYVPVSTIIVTDLANRLFVMRKPDGTYKKVSTYGALSGNEPGHVAENVPNSLKEIVEFVTSYDNPNAIGFYPEYIEVVIEPYNDDSKKNVKWPKDFPGLNDSKTIKHKEYDRFSLFVNVVKDAHSEKLDDVTYKPRKSESAMLIDKKRWVVETRIPFPSEAIWLGNFRD